VFVVSDEIPVFSAANPLNNVPNAAFTGLFSALPNRRLAQTLSRFGAAPVNVDLMSGALQIDL
jgi:hypothetical protein